MAESSSNVTASVEQQQQQQETSSLGSLEQGIEKAKRSFALKRYEEAVEFYTSALEIATQKFGDMAIENADLYFSYGQALLENAISQSSVLGANKDQKDEGDEDHDNEPQASTSSNRGPILAFSGDGDEQDTSVDLFGNSEKAITEEEDPEQGEDDNEGEDNDEPEDDFNAAWEVLEIARTLYAKQAESQTDPMPKFKLAEAHIALGDVSLETEKFEDAIVDYQRGLDLKKEILPLSSRQIAEAHYKLCMVLDMTSGRLSEAISHSEQALKSVDQRLVELEARAKSPEASSTAEPSSTGSQSTFGDSVLNLSASQVQAELKELRELRDDVALKVEELKMSPNENPEGGSAPELVAAALDRALNGSRPAPTGLGDTKVNDLTSIVKKKQKKPVEQSTPNGTMSETASGKRKAEESAPEESTSEKKIRLAP